MTVEAGKPSEGAERRPGALLLLCMAQFMLILGIANPVCKFLGIG